MIFVPVRASCPQRLHDRFDVLFDQVPFAPALVGGAGSIKPPDAFLNQSPSTTRIVRAVAPPPA